MSTPRKAWSDLTATAVLGAERASGMGAHLNVSGAIGNALTTAKGKDGESTLLNAAAILTTCIHAGQMPRTLAQAPEPSAHPEIMPACGRPFEVLLARILKGEHRNVLPEGLRLLNAAERRVPWHLLPQLLDLLTEEVDLRHDAGRALGERSIWLARQNPHWRWLVNDGSNAQEIWQTGNSQQRIGALESLRASDPSNARSLVEKTWSQESPEHRLGIISLFRINLTSSDEPFLENALDDKRKEVRRMAADLLARFSESHLCQRMRGRLTSLLTFQGKQKKQIVKLARGQKARIEVTLLNDCDKTMIRDGIEPKPPHNLIGEKAWWLQQMIAATPPDHWSSRWNASPEDIIAAAKETEWAMPLLDGFAGAAARHGDRPWIVTLIENWLGQLAFADALGRVDLINNIMHALGPELATPMLLQLLKSKTMALHETAVLHLLRGARFDWSAELSGAVLNAMQQVFAKWGGGHEYTILTAAEECFALTMSPSVGDEADKGWPTDAANWPPLNTRHMNNFLSTLQFRRQLHKEIHS
jgi:Family of unknown function (DUF5691)